MGSFSCPPSLLRASSLRVAPPRPAPHFPCAPNNQCQKVTKSAKSCHRRLRLRPGPLPASSVLPLPIVEDTAKPSPAWCIPGRHAGHLGQEIGAASLSCFAPTTAGRHPRPDNTGNPAAERSGGPETKRTAPPSFNLGMHWNRLHWAGIPALKPGPLLSTSCSIPKTSAQPVVVGEL